MSRFLKNVDPKNYQKHWSWKHRILVYAGGSQLYGTALLASDVDLRYIYMMPVVEALGVSGTSTIVPHFIDKEACVDVAGHMLNHWVKLALDGNPTALEGLFCDSQVKFSNGYWETILQRRNNFVSKRAVPKFIGKARSDLARTKRHKSFVDNPPVKPMQEDFGGVFKDNHYVYSDPRGQERYSKAKNDWDAYYFWASEGSAERRELIRQFGYDLKDACNIFRGLGEISELLQYGYITYPRPDAAFLRSIRYEGMNFDRMLALVDETIHHIDNHIAPHSSIPDQPNEELIVNMLMDLNSEWLGISADRVKTLMELAS